MVESYSFLDGVNGNTTNLVSEMSLSGVTIGTDILSNDYRYTYDNNGNITEIYRFSPFIGRWVKTNAYEYDAQNQLTVERNTDTATAYTYSATGNILSKKVYYIDDIDDELDEDNLYRTRNYSYDNTNWKDLLTSYNGNSITYDAIGNPLTYDGNTYSWTQGRRLAIASNQLNMLRQDGLKAVLFLSSYHPIPQYLIITHSIPVNHAPVP